MRSEPAARTQISEVVEALLIHLPATGEVLDLGCGTGHHAVALAESGLSVTALDYSAAMLMRARTRALERSVVIDFREFDLNQDLPFAAKVFDGALCVSVLQVLDDPSRFLAQVREVLRPGGHLVVESVRKLGALSRGNPLDTRDRIINRLKVLAAKIPGAVREYQPGDIADLLAAAGMQVVETATYDATFTLLARRP